MPKDLESFTPSEPKKDAKDALKGLHQKVEALTTPEQKVEQKIGSHLRNILGQGGYLKKAVVDEEPNEVLDARTREEAERMVKDLVSNFEHSLKQNPDLFEGLTQPMSFNATFKHMLIWSSEGGNLYWDVNVGVDGDNIKVDAPLVLAG